jgi:hypothetical protein
MAMKKTSGNSMQRNTLGLLASTRNGELASQGLSLSSTLIKMPLGLLPRWSHFL